MANGLSPLQLPSELSCTSFLTEQKNWSDMRSTLLVSSQQCDPLLCTPKFLTLTKPSECALQRTTSSLSHHSLTSQTFPHDTSSCLQMPQSHLQPDGFVLHNLISNQFAGSSMLEDAQVTHANISTCASPVLGNIPSRSVGLKRKVKCSSNDFANHWERPWWTRGFLWSKDSVPSSPPAALTEFAEPLPLVPSLVLQNSTVTQTISDNPSLFKIITLININCFEALLVTHPNQPLVSSVCRSLRFGLLLVLMTQHLPLLTFLNTQHVRLVFPSSESSVISNFTVNGILLLLVLSFFQACLALPLGLFLNHILTNSALLMTLVLVHMLQTHGSPASIHLSNSTICKILVLYFAMFTNVTNNLLPGYSRMTYLVHFITFQFTLSGRLSKLS